MRLKRFLTAALALVMTAALAAPFSAGAVESSFQDISDPVTAVNADVLRLMGVVDGTGGNQFNPGGSLTRAEFCTMVVKFMQRGNEVPVYATRTIFSDVTASHWGLGYVNLAASINVGTEEAPIALISGVGDGRFEPDTRITMAQAVTILIRVLGYSDEQTGAAWPQSYLNLADSIGLTDGVTAGPYDELTRAQAAQLFVNALSCKKGNGTVYYNDLGSGMKVTEDVIVLAVNVETDDGTSRGAVRTTASGSGESTTAEAYLPANGRGEVYALQGKRGAQVLNERDELVAFIPDDSSSVTITLSGDAQPSYVRGTNGQQYTISSTTPVYTSSQSEGKGYLESYTGLYSGTQLTMYSERGKIVAIYANSGATTVDSDAVVVMGSPSTAMFHQLTGGAANFQIVKNRQPIRMSDIKAYDVVTYDEINNTLVVSDLRLTCIYEDASPNAATPTSITVLGHTFDVLDSTWETTEGLSIGDSVTLLLTADGKVAGMAPASGKLRSTAIGMVDGGTANVFLPNGGTLKLSGTISNADHVADQLVTISSGSKGRISASRLTSRSAPGAFAVEDMTLGSYTVTAGVQVYEQISGGAMVKVGLDHLGLTQIPADKIAAYHLNSSNMVDYIVLEEVTGNAYDYGMIVLTTETSEERVSLREPQTIITPDGDELTIEYEVQKDEDGNVIFSNGKPVYITETVSSRTCSLVSRSRIEFAPQYSYNGRSGDFVGVAVGQNRENKPIIKAVIQLQEIKGITPGDFFESQGATYVNANGRTYRVADEVECYRPISSNRLDTANWFSQETGAERLTAYRAYSSDLTIYVDPVGEQVRIVRAN